MPSVVLESVHKVFRRSGLFFRKAENPETYALRGLSLSILPGEVLALLGPNGSGKSTTLRLISTMLLPDQGRVLVNGLDTRRHAPQVRQCIGIALAAERSFFPRLTARENLEFFAALENVPRRQRPGRVEAALQQVELADSGSKQVMKFSSGMYQRLAIARALLKNARVLLLDEPTRSLDPVAAARLIALVRDIAATGITVVHATHNLTEALTVSDRVAILHQGHLAALRHSAGITPRQLHQLYLETVGEAAPRPWHEEVPA
jgi:ABC-2 type transport system ATP-binding protein